MSSWQIVYLYYSAQSRNNRPIIRIATTRSSLSFNFPIVFLLPARVPSRSNSIARSFSISFPLPSFQELGRSISFGKRKGFDGTLEEYCSYPISAPIFGIVSKLFRKHSIIYLPPHPYQPSSISLFLFLFFVN